MLTCNCFLVIYTDIGAIKLNTQRINKMSDATLAAVTFSVILYIIGHVTDGKVKKTNKRPYKYRPMYKRY